MAPWVTLLLPSATETNSVPSRRTNAPEQSGWDLLKPLSLPGAFRSTVHVARSSPSLPLASVTGEVNTKSSPGEKTGFLLWGLTGRLSTYWNVAPLLTSLKLRVCTTSPEADRVGIATAAPATTRTASAEARLNKCRSLVSGNAGAATVSRRVKENLKTGYRGWLPQPPRARAPSRPARRRFPAHLRDPRWSRTLRGSHRAPSPARSSRSPSRQR